MKERGSSAYKTEVIRPEIEAGQEEERGAIIPVIDIIRHGKTDYKELNDPDYRLNPEAPDFKLDPEHLDLNEQGIREIEKTAEQLLGMIDKDNEMVLLVTSPNYRARSSQLLISRRLSENGVTILNPGDQIHQAESLHQIDFRDKGMQPIWRKQDKMYRDRDPRHKTQSPDNAHAAIARELGYQIDDLFTEDYEDIDRRFQRFLRHMTNAEKWLQPETKEVLQGKKLRIVCLTHEELPARFMKDSLQVQENLKNGQILEIQPASQLPKGGQNVNRVILYPKGGDSETGQAEILRTFKIENN